MISPILVLLRVCVCVSVSLLYYVSRVCLFWRVQKKMNVLRNLSSLNFFAVRFNTLATYKLFHLIGQFEAYFED